jgi:CheY-like chemotaxis protein
MKLRILYVDDEEDIREVAEMSLMVDSSVDVRTCASGEEAVAQAKEWRPDVILLDVMMPGMDGRATFGALKSHSETKDVPVIFITALSQASEISALMSLGPRGVLAKPFDPMKLTASVREMISGDGKRPDDD